MTQKARLILCVLILAYLAGDLFLFNGPLNRAIQASDPGSPAAIEKARKNGVIAQVFKHSISGGQLYRAVSELLWSEGKKFAELSPDDQKTSRKTALNELIEHEILRTLIANADPKFEVSTHEIDERYQQFAARFGSKDDLSAAMTSQGISSEKNLRDRIAAHLLEEKFFESKIAPTIKATEDEAKKWFTDHQQSLGIPERVEVRHLFIATLETPADQAKQKLDAALAALTAKQKDFETLAKEISEDPASKDNGGKLGWMTRQRLAPDFAEPVFSLPVSQPSLIRTKLGWHLIEITGRRAAEARTFEDAKAEIIAALEAVKRREAVKALRDKIRHDSAAGIHIYDATLSN